MLMLLLFIVVITVLIVLHVIGAGYANALSDFWAMCAIGMGVIIVTTLMIGLINYYDSYDMAEEREAIVLTMDDFMDEDDVYADAFDKEILNFNTSLYNYRKQYSNLWLNLGVSHIVNEVEPITEKR